MASSTIKNSAGPGSATELSPVTIAVRDKVIEKFADLPLEQMNESVKRLLAHEKDEHKRLGVLAARVYILRQRIVSLTDADRERVVSSKSPSVDDTLATDELNDAGEATKSEWTRLRILEDCEVNGVRFPKSVIIDVKTADAERLIENGNAELVDEAPETDNAAEDVPTPATNDAATDTQSGADAAVSSTDTADDTETSDTNGDIVSEARSVGELETEGPADASPPAEETEAAGKEAVIEAPSAAEVTAALAALSSGNDGAAETPVTPTEPTSSTATSVEDEEAAVFAALEAASSAMGNDPVATASAEEASNDEDQPAKKGGWLEAQQKAENATEDEDRKDG